MIKKRYKLIPILGSKRELVTRHLVQKKDTHQFGTINPTSLRGKQSRRNLRESFDPISLYLVDPEATLDYHEIGILTLKDGSKVLGMPYDYSEEDVVFKEKISYFQRDLFDFWVDARFTLGKRGEDELPFIKFRIISPKALQLILERGGNLWLQMEDNTQKLYQDKPIIHLVG